MYDKTRANLIKNLRKESNRGHFFDVLIFCCFYFDHQIVSSHTENLFNLISLLTKNVDCLLLPLIFHHGPALSFWIYDFLLFLLPFVFRFFCLHFFHWRIRTSIHFEFMLVFLIVFFALHIFNETRIVVKWTWHLMISNDSDIHWLLSTISNI